ncbi:MAG: hypothetical protein K8823_1493 [Cenarchaeum symbiont of Oopsacas minuta]|nr:hypothetical protein [Cenarchaeum symbiont of Oopsacas minuta]
MEDSTHVLMQHYGISPWELEVAYGIFNNKFSVEQEDTEYEGDEYVSIFEIDIPVVFGDAFFDWFGRKEWNKLKFLLKEMKRRRGGRKAIKTIVNFSSVPAVRFVVDVQDRDWYNDAIEKIDFMTELISHHLSADEIPKGTNAVTYRYIEKTKKWSILKAVADGCNFIKKDDVWINQSKRDLDL